MKLILSILFFGIIGLLAGVQYTPEAALIGGSVFAIAGAVLAMCVVLPLGILGEGTLGVSAKMDVKEKKIREDIADFVNQMEAIMDLAEKDDLRDLTDEESKNWEDLNEKATNKKKDLERYLATQAHRDSMAASSINDDGKKDGKIPEVKINGSQAEGEKALYGLTAELFMGIAGKSEGKILQAQHKLFDGGHYIGKNFEKVRNAGFETLSDDGGGIFLPTIISDKIFEYEALYGFIPRHAQSFPIPKGRHTFPNTTGTLTFFAIAEGSEIKARKYSFGGITLDAHKWGVIVPWTKEIEAETGRKLVENVMKKIGTASAAIKDTTFFIGDGTSTYHNIIGIGPRGTASDVSVLTAVSGNVSFATLDPDDYLLLQKKLPAALRSKGMYVVHPDRLFEFMLWEDGAGNFVPKSVFSMNDNGEVRIWGRPVFFTESAFNTDGTSKYVAAYVDPEFLAFGNGQNITAERLSEATIIDIDDSTAIRLGVTDQVALKFTERWDMNFGLNNAFALLKTAAS